MKEYKFCQSCGFPLKKDKKGGGSEKTEQQAESFAQCAMRMVNF